MPKYLPGQSGNPNGRPVGSLNKIKPSFKTALEEAYKALQAEYPDTPHGHLIMWAKENQTEFYKIKSKLLPIQLTGDEENPIAVKDVTSKILAQLPMEQLEAIVQDQESESLQ